MDVTLGRDTLLALAAVAWADGKIAPEEAASLRSAAAQLGLGENDSRILEEALSRGVDPIMVETIRMNRSTRLFVYAAATWMAEVDGPPSKEEEGVLQKLGDRLGLSTKARQRAARAVTAMGTFQGDQRSRHDLLALHSSLADDLSESADD